MHKASQNALLGHFCSLTYTAERSNGAQQPEFWNTFQEPEPNWLGEFFPLSAPPFNASLFVSVPMRYMITFAICLWFSEKRSPLSPSVVITLCLGPYR